MAAIVGGFVLVATLAVLAGCGFFVDPKLTSIAVSPASPTVTIGHTQQMSATGTFDDSSTKDMTSSVTWTTSSASVATVTSAGVVTGVSAGTATITATSGSLTATATVTVTAGTIVSIAVTPTNPTIAVNGTQQFKAIATFSDNTTNDITSSVTWNSSTPAVATITTAGVATGVAAGTTNITASSGSVTSPAAVLTVQ